jgi:hypothetical protein
MARPRKLLLCKRHVVSYRVKNVRIWEMAVSGEEGKGCLQPVFLLG